MAAPAWLTARPIAHRGLHDASDGRVENSLAAAEAALGGGFGIEADVRLAADGVPMVFHDADLDRLTRATGRLADMRSDDLGGIGFADGPGRIPTLGALLDLVRGRVPLYLEAKSEDGNAGALAAAVAARLAGYGGPAAVMSFTPASVAAFGRAAPDRPRGLISRRYDDPEDADEHGPVRRFALRHLLFAFAVLPQFTAYDVRALPAAAPAIARRLGLPLLAWTVRTAADRRIAAAHADQMIFEGLVPDA